MRGVPILTCCWPGLARLWLRGDWSAFMLAVGFAALLNLALMTSFLWPGSLGQGFPWIAWPLIASWWTISWWLSYRALPDLCRPQGIRQEQSDELFQLAQTEYLQGHWAEAEGLLNQILSGNQRDVDARMMLATLYRHTRRLDDARRQLDRITQVDAGIKWSLEVAQEGALLDRLEAEVNEEDETELIQDQEHQNVDLKPHQETSASPEDLPGSKAA